MIDLGSGGNITVYWTAGSEQFFTLTEKSCIRFIPPFDATSVLTLEIYDTSTGGHIVGWPTSIMWEKFSEHNGPLTYFPGVGDYYLFRFYWNEALLKYLGWYHGPFRTYSGTGCTCP
jgi:hypothetical protein